MAMPAMQPQIPKKLQRFIGSDNIADDLDKTELDEIGSRVIRETNIDIASRENWDKRMESAMDLALQVQEEKTWPWPNAANVKFPLLTVAAVQFNARSYPAIVPGKNIVKGKVNGDDTGMYEVQIGPDGQPMMDEQGQPVTEEIMPPGIKQARADRVSHHMSWQLAEEMEEWEPDTDRLLMVLPIVGTVFRKTYFDPNKGRNTSQMILGKHLYVNYDAKSLEDAPRITQEFTLYPHQITERIRGDVFVEFDYPLGSEDEQEPQTFYEQHRLLDLDDDDYPEPYIVTVHKDTGKTCRIVARYEEDGIQLERGEVIKIEPIHYFTKYGFMPNPESAIYDLGFGMLLGPINETVNTILNQMLDAGTIQNAGGGFIGKGLRIKGGTMRFRPGEYKPVDVTGGKIADNLYTMQHAGPSVVLFQLLGLLIEAGKEIASTKDVLTGEAQGANASPTTTLAMIEQGSKQFTAVFKRVHRSFKSELRKLYDLNRRYLPQEVYFTLMDDQEAVVQQDYAEGDHDIIPVSDPTVVTDMQKMGRAQALLQFNGDPFVNQMEIRRRYLDSIGTDDVDQLLQEPTEPGPELKDQLKAMELELEGMIQEKKLPAEIAEMMASALKDVAEAESKEAGIQLDAYRTFIEAMANEYSSNQGAVPGVAGKPSNGSVSPVPAGPGGGVLEGAPAGGLPPEPGRVDPAGNPLSGGGGQPPGIG